MKEKIGGRPRKGNSRGQQGNVKNAKADGGPKFFLER